MTFSNKFKVRVFSEMPSVTLWNTEKFKHLFPIPLIVLK